jgi:nitrite reductase/ring-hydroxylating ferredoxin subunit
VGHLLARLIAANDGWAKPFGEFNHRWVFPLFHAIRPIRDFLNGTWLGHPVHPAVTDVPIGAALVAIVLDLLGEPTAAFWAAVITLVTLLAAAVTGLADYADTDGTARTRATLHGTIMVVGTVLTLVSVIIRLTAPGYDGGGAAVGLLIVGFLVLAAGAYVGGDVVFVLGNMVSRHAFRGAGTKWIKLDTGDVTDLATLPEATPRKMKAGINDLVVVRIGDTIHALHAVCSHAGGPLAEGTVTPDGCLECPWHQSRFRLSDGRLRQGPAVYDQPAYEVRAAEAGGYEVRRAAP